jgi:large subunit ribosomal protein L21
MSDAQAGAQEAAPKAQKTAAKTRSPKKTSIDGAALQFPYAVIRTGSKQYRVSKGEMILVEKLEVEPGQDWSATEVLFVAKAPGDFVIGKPEVKGAKVMFEVLQQTLDKKILIRHARRRQSSQKTLGHRQMKTRLLVKEITL